MDLSPYFSQAMSLYSSQSQIARSVTEQWASDNLYCPRCGGPLTQYRNNTKVYDFYCEHSSHRLVLVPSPPIDNFQLKSTKSFPNNTFPHRISGAEYHTTVRSLEEGTFPSIALIHYNREVQEVQDGLFIHRLSITLNAIKKRAPLSANARRRGWVGSEILLDNIPEIGRIPVVQESQVVPKETVMRKWDSVERVLIGNLERRGWISEVLLLIDSLPASFSLDDIYASEPYLARRFPDNKHIKDKIRQQLQILRDRGYLEFQGMGKYRKLNH